MRLRIPIGEVIKVMIFLAFLPTLIGFFDPNLSSQFSHILWSLLYIVLSFILEYYQLLLTVCAFILLIALLKKIILYIQKLSLEFKQQQIYRRKRIVEIEKQKFNLEIQEKELEKNRKILQETHKFHLEVKEIELEKKRKILQETHRTWDDF